MIKIILLLLISCSSTFASDFKLSENLSLKLKSNSKVDAIIFLNQNEDLSIATQIIDRTSRIQFVYDKLRESAKRSQGTLIKAIQDEGLEFKSFYLVNAIAIKNASESQLMKLSGLAEVEKIDFDVEAKLKLPVTNPALIPKTINPNEIPENFKQIGIDKVWNENDMGLGIVIAGQDSGYKWDHPALKAQYRGYTTLSINHNYNWHDAIRQKINPKGVSSSCGYNLQEPCDDRGHGTHTMGTMLGYDYVNKTNRIGVAPQAKWIGCRNMDQGTGKVSTYLECFEYFLAPYPLGADPKTEGNPAYAPHIINNSWGCPTTEGCTGNEFIQAIDALQSAGIIVIAAAGNDGPGCGTVSTAPGFYSGKLISVAAYDHHNGEIASFSSRGPSTWNGAIGPNITAPGNAIRSSVPSGGLGDGFYDYKSGTSMSAPHVAGVVALLWSARPELIGNIKATMDLLEKTATPKTSSQTCGNFAGNQAPNAVFGYGIVDAYKAIKSH